VEEKTIKSTNMQTHSFIFYRTFQNGRKIPNIDEYMTSTKHNTAI